MKVHQIFFKNTLRNFCYLISFDDGAIYCIDPFSSNEVVSYLKTMLNNQALKTIINTHDHCDHYSGNANLLDFYKCDVMAHAKALIPHRSHGLVDREVFYKSGEWSLRAVYTPGHTSSHLCVLLELSDTPYAIFTGDCLFNAGVGHCRDGNPEVLYQTIDKIFGELPDDVLVYPGHEYLARNLAFTKNYEPENIEAQEFLKTIEPLNLDEVFFINSMKVERAINTFLRLESPDLKRHLKLENANSKKIFLTLREYRNNW